MELERERASLERPPASLFGPFAERARELAALGERLETERDAETVAEYRSILERAWRNEVHKSKV